MKDTIKSPSIDTGIDITKMHGHMDIYLTDVKTGEVEEVHEDNMMTNAIQEYFRNCGFLNYPNININNLVYLLLGGILAFNDEIQESADIMQVPSGLKMTANGAVGVVNNGEVLELGSYSSTESGWQNDGSYIQTYDYTTSQANGTIGCVCLTSREYGIAGDGNSVSNVKSPTIKGGLYSDEGSPTTIHGITGTVFKIDLADSSCYTFAIETRQGVSEEYYVGVVRKYRIPLSKLNIRGTLTNPIILSEDEIAIDSDLSDSSINYFAYGGYLYLWNLNLSDNEWGDGFTQYLWRVSSAGTISKTTVINTSGDTLFGLQQAYFDGDYIFFPKSDEPRTIDTRTIYILNRTTGAINSVDTEYGAKTNFSTVYNLQDRCGYVGFVYYGGSGSGRICVTGGPSGVGPGGYGTVIDKSGWAYPHDAGQEARRRMFPINDLIYFSSYDQSNREISDGFALYRTIRYIASINNLDNPVVKTSEKTMKIIYRITFDE